MGTCDVQLFRLVIRGCETGVRVFSVVPMVVGRAVLWGNVIVVMISFVIVIAGVHLSPAERRT